jgi:ABC-type amino acid transport substrate-binding protein
VKIDTSNWFRGISSRLQWLAGLGALCLAMALPALADGIDSIRQKGRLRVAVYNDFPPYSFDGRGVDVEIGRVLAERLGVQAEIAWYNAGEDMNDDLRNMVWKGHYLGTQPSDVMLHVPLDPHFAAQNDKVRIFAPYHVEVLALARLPSRVAEPSGSAAVALDVFTREKVGVEGASGSDDFLLGVLNGRLRENVVHYRSVTLAAAGLRAGEVAAVMAPRAELEAALKGDRTYPVSIVKMPELRIGTWSLAMAVKSDDVSLAEALTAALIGLQQDGTVARIFGRYGITHQLPGG